MDSVQSFTFISRYTIRNCHVTSLSSARALFRTLSKSQMKQFKIQFEPILSGVFSIVFHKHTTTQVDNKAPPSPGHKIVAFQVGYFYIMEFGSITLSRPNHL